MGRTYRVHDNGCYWGLEVRAEDDVHVWVDITDRLVGGPRTEGDTRLISLYTQACIDVETGRAT